MKNLVLISLILLPNIGLSESTNCSQPIKKHQLCLGDDVQFEDVVVSEAYEGLVLNPIFQGREITSALVAVDRNEFSSDLTAEESVKEDLSKEVDELIENAKQNGELQRLTLSSIETFEVRDGFAAVFFFCFSFNEDETCSTISKLNSKEKSFKMWTDFGFKLAQNDAIELQSSIFSQLEPTEDI
ncbi:MAG: hypothetical protein AAF429_10675 [Pseudomonadota bacterium]